MRGYHINMYFVISFVVRDFFSRRKQPKGKSREDLKRLERKRMTTTENRTICIGITYVNGYLLIIIHNKQPVYTNQLSYSNSKYLSCEDNAFTKKKIGQDTI